MRTIETENRVIASLSEKASEEMLLLKGPQGTRVVVMSPEEFVQKWLPQSLSSDDTVTREGVGDNNVRAMWEYIVGCN